MLVKGLDGSISTLNLKGGISKGSAVNKSALHLEARNLVRRLYPTMQILEEITIYPRKNEVMYMDFYIPLLKKCIEVHGEQHYKFIPFYHNNVLSFVKAQKRDRDKKEWCYLNNIEYCELPYNKVHEWESIINHENS